MDAVSVFEIVDGVVPVVVATQIVAVLVGVGEVVQTRRFGDRVTVALAKE